MLRQNEIKQSLTESGFSSKQVNALMESFAQYPHTHNVVDIKGFDEAVQETVDEAMEDEGEGEDEGDGDGEEL